MSETANDLASRLPSREWSGDPLNDRRAIDHHIANAERLRSEAVDGMVRALMAWFRGMVKRASGRIAGTASHQV